MHAELERGLADLCATEDALTFNSGWSANPGLLATLPESGVRPPYVDALNHASLIDGASCGKRRGPVTRILFPHADVGAWSANSRPGADLALPTA